MSNRGPEIDVIAPGGDHRAEIRTLGADRQLGPPHWIVTLEQGTSMAAAHVSGGPGTPGRPLAGAHPERCAGDPGSFGGGTGGSGKGRPVRPRSAGRVRPVRGLSRNPFRSARSTAPRARQRQGRRVSRGGGAAQRRSAQRRSAQPDRPFPRRRSGWRSCAGAVGRRRGPRDTQGATPVRSRGVRGLRQPDLSAGRAVRRSSGRPSQSASRSQARTRGWSSPSGLSTCSGWRPCTASVTARRSWHPGARRTPR